MRPVAPYVSVERSAGVAGRAIVDTGADWSLLADKQVTARERLAIRPSIVRGRDVSSENIPVPGEVWRTVTVGGVRVLDQRPFTTVPCIT